MMFIGIYYPKLDKMTLPAIVMEKMHSSLRGLVEHANIPMNVTLSILNDVCLGLQYLHTREPPIVHQNLTPNNILLCYHFKAKISDIGIVNRSHINDTQALSQLLRMHPFVSLKSLTSKLINDLSLDVFSFGGVILYTATRQWPQLKNSVADTGRRTVLTELQQCQQYIDKMAGGYVDLKPLVVSCLDDNPEKCPSIVQVLMEIKRVKNSYSEQFCSSLWESEISDEQRSLTTQLHEQTEQQQLQQDKQNQQQHPQQKQHEKEWQQKSAEQKQQKEYHLDGQQPQLLKASCISWLYALLIFYLQIYLYI